MIFFNILFDNFLYKPSGSRSEFSIRILIQQIHPAQDGSQIRTLYTGTNVLLLLSYTLFIVLLPVTYWICILKLKQTDRIVIFR